VQLGVEQMCQASVELPSITDHTGCGMQSYFVGTPGSCQSSSQLSKMHFLTAKFSKYRFCFFTFSVCDRLIVAPF